MTKPLVPSSEAESFSPQNGLAPENVRLLPDDSEISLIDLLIVITRGRRAIAKTVLICTLLGVIVSLVWPVTYTATTSILPPQQGASVGSAVMAQLNSLSSVASMAGGGYLGLKNPNDLQVALLRSRIVEDAIIQRFDIMAEYHEKRLSDARKLLEKIVDVDSGLKDGLIRISAADRDPNRAAQIANGYVDEFRRRTAGLAVTEASQRRLFFEEQLSKTKNDLSNAEDRLKTTEQKTGVIQMDSQARATIELVAQLRAQVSAKEVQIAAMRSFATNENPDLKVAEEELAGLKNQLQKMGADANSTSDPMVPNGSIQGQGLEYARRLRDVRYYETIFDLLARQLEIAKVDEARQGSIVQVVDPAAVPDRRSSPHRTLIVLASALLGLLLGLGLCLLREMVKRIKNDPSEGSRLAALREATRS